MNKNDIVAVLVVAGEGDPGGLFGVGPCRSVSPWVAPPGHAADEPEWSSPTVWHKRDASTCAIPLMWDHKLVTAGWDLVRRVASYNPGSASNTADGFAKWEQAIARFHPSLADVLLVARTLEEDKRVVSRVICLTRAGVKLVELPR